MKINHWLLVILIFLGFFFKPANIYSQQINSQTEFILEMTDSSCLLFCCIPSEKYNPRTLFPGKEEPYNSRKVVQTDPSKPPIYVVGSYWQDGCLMIKNEYTEWDDNVWVEFITQFTLFNSEEIKLIRTKK